VAVNLNKAPLVIQKREVVPVRLNRQEVAKREDFIINVKTQSLEDVRYVLRAVSIQETDKQVRLGNEPNRVVVDNREGKQLRFAQRKIEVFFGDILDQIMLKSLEKALMASIRFAVAGVLKNTPGLRPDQISGIRALASGQSWEWRYSPGRGSPARKVNPYRIGAMPAGAFLVYMPTNAYAGLANMLAARLDAGWRGYSQLWQRGRSGGRGFAVKAVEKIRRGRLLKNYDITVAFTRRYAIPGEVYHPGTGDRKEPKSTVCIRIRTRRRTRGYRRRTS
jgi:hypothetical protein